MFAIFLENSFPYALKLILKKGFIDSYVLNFTGEVRSLFGHSISCLGDIDKDGYNGELLYIFTR